MYGRHTHTSRLIAVALTAACLVPSAVFLTAGVTASERLDSIVVDPADDLNNLGPAEGFDYDAWYAAVGADSFAAVVTNHASWSDPATPNDTACDLTGVTVYNASDATVFDLNFSETAWGVSFEWHFFILAADFGEGAAPPSFMCTLHYVNSTYYTILFQSDETGDVSDIIVADDVNGTMVTFEAPHDFLTDIGEDDFAFFVFFVSEVPGVGVFMDFVANDLLLSGLGTDPSTLPGGDDADMDGVPDDEEDDGGDGDGDDGEDDGDGDDGGDGDGDETPDYASENETSFVFGDPASDVVDMTSYENTSAFDLDDPAVRLDLLDPISSGLPVTNADNVDVVSCNLTLRNSSSVDVLVFDFVGLFTVGALKSFVLETYFGSWEDPFVVTVTAVNLVVGVLPSASFTHENVTYDVDDSDLSVSSTGVAVNVTFPDAVDPTEAYGFLVWGSVDRVFGLFGDEPPETDVPLSDELYADAFASDAAVVAAGGDPAAIPGGDDYVYVPPPDGDGSWFGEEGYLVIMSLLSAATAVAVVAVIAPMFSPKSRKAKKP